MLEERHERNKLRSVVMKARERKLLSQEEIGFVVTLTERFRADIEKKVKQLHLLQGEISQLKNNEQVIINVVESLISAAERDIARQETMENLKNAREEQEDNKEE